MKRIAMGVEIRGAIMAHDSRMKSVQKDAEDTLREALGERAEELIANRKKRDGDKAHVTLLGPQDGKKAIAMVAAMEDLSKSAAEKRIAEMAEALPGTWKARGVGKATLGGKVAYFVVIDWPEAKEFRTALGVDPNGQDFHLTVGFGDTGDVFGVPKNKPLSPAELRLAMIRLAHAQPQLRRHLLPLLR